MTSEVNLQTTNNNLYLNNDDIIYDKLNQCGECHANSSFVGSSNTMPTNSSGSGDKDTASLDSGCESSYTNGKLCSLDINEHCHSATDLIPRRRKITNTDG